MNVSQRAAQQMGVTLAQLTAAANGDAAAMKALAAGDGTSRRRAEHGRAVGSAVPAVLRREIDRRRHMTRIPPARSTRRQMLARQRACMA
jgi:hypothetical protein